MKTRSFVFALSSLAAIALSSCAPSYLETANQDWNAAYSVCTQHFENTAPFKTLLDPSGVTAKCKYLAQRYADRQAAKRKTKQDKVVASYGGQIGYNIHMQQASWDTLYEGCMQSMPIPATQYQDEWEQANCTAYVNGIAGHRMHNQ